MIDEPPRPATDAGPELDPDVDYDLLDYLLTLTPAQRLERHEQAMELVRALWAAGAELYGFDPRAPEEAE